MGPQEGTSLRVGAPLPKFIPGQTIGLKRFLCLINLEHTNAY